MLQGLQHIAMLLHAIEGDLCTGMTSVSKSVPTELMSDVKDARKSMVDALTRYLDALEDPESDQPSALLELVVPHPLMSLAALLQGLSAEKDAVRDSMSVSNASLPAFAPLLQQLTRYTEFAHRSIDTWKADARERAVLQSQQAQTISLQQVVAASAQRPAASYGSYGRRSAQPAKMPSMAPPAYAQQRYGMPFIPPPPPAYYGTQIAAPAPGFQSAPAAAGFRPAAPARRSSDALRIVQQAGISKDMGCLQWDGTAASCPAAQLCRQSDEQHASPPRDDSTPAYEDQPDLEVDAAYDELQREPLPPERSQLQGSANLPNEVPVPPSRACTPHLPSDIAAARVQQVLNRLSDS